MTHECPYDGLYDAWSVRIFDILAKWVFIVTRSTCSSPALFGNYDWPTDRLTARNPQITGSMESYTSNNQESMINNINKHDDVFPLICTAALGRGRDYSRLKQYRQAKPIFHPLDISDTDRPFWRLYSLYAYDVNEKIYPCFISLICSYS